MREGEALGSLLKEARVAKGISKEALAHELKLPLRHLEAVESDDWEALPPGRGRPLARQLAERLGLDLEIHTGAFQTLPGRMEADPPDPRQERMERIVMGGLTLASVLVLLWLLLPGQQLRGRTAPSWLTENTRGPISPPPPPATGAYPVLGELLPEAPVNEKGTLVTLRAQDTCEVSIQADGPELDRTLRVSEPWTLRLKGPFSISLSNAGVAIVEVAGHRIVHGASVGEAWSGKFDEEGHWLKPAPRPLPAGAPPKEAPEESGEPSETPSLEAKDPSQS